MDLINTNFNNIIDTYSSILAKLNNNKPITYFEYLFLDTLPISVFSLRSLNRKLDEIEKSHNLHNENRGGFLVTPSDSPNIGKKIYKIALQFT